MVNWEEGMEAIVPRVRMPMYKVLVEEIRWEAVFPGSEPFMLMLHADCSLFDSGSLLVKQAHSRDASGNCAESSRSARELVFVDRTRRVALV